MVSESVNKRILACFHCCAKTLSMSVLCFSGFVFYSTALKTGKYSVRLLCSYNIHICCILQYCIRLIFTYKINLNLGFKNYVKMDFVKSFCCKYIVNIIWLFITVIGFNNSLLSFCFLWTFPEIIILKVLQNLCKQSF